MTRTRAAAWAARLAASAGACAGVHAQSPHPASPERIADGDWVFHTTGTCGKAEAALRAGRRIIDDDPWGTIITREVTADTDVLNCSLDIELVPTSSTSGTITGSNTFTIRSNVNGLTQFTFRLRSQFTASATINGATPVTLSQLSTTTRLATLDRAYSAGETFALRVSYSGVPMSIGTFGSVNFTTQNGLPLFQTLSEPYYGYTWWPCKDGDVGADGDNSDKFTAQVAVTAPDTMVSVSNGLLQGVDTLSGSRKKYRWATNYPLCTYLLAIGSTPYTQWEKTYTYPLPGGGTATMPVQFSIYTGNDTPAHRSSWEQTLDMMAAYRPYYGEYPFVNEKYGVYNFNFGGGEEHQTYTGEGTFDEGVTAHELGHQWWGDNVTAKTWHDIWLNEGFATFTEALWFQYKPGSTGWPAYFTRMGLNKPTQVAESVYRNDLSSATTIFSTNYSYRKPGWALHCLRGLVGDATFWNILQTYRATYQGSAATTTDFAAVASNVYGQDLTWFFTQWIMSPGAPAYAGGWQTANIGGQNYLRLRIRQTQSATYPIFTMPMNIRINTTSGTQYARVWNDAATEWYVLPVAAPVTSIVLDESSVASPSPWILSTGITSEAYANGPPKIVQSSAAPGAAIPAASAPGPITVTFSENVNAPAAAFSLVGPGGSMPLTVAYDPVNFRATLDPGVLLSRSACSRP